MGLANACVPHEQLDAEVQKWAEELCERSPTALAIAKRSFNMDTAHQSRHRRHGHVRAQALLRHRGIEAKASMRSRRSASPSSASTRSRPSLRRRLQRRTCVNPYLDEDLVALGRRCAAIRGRPHRPWLSGARPDARARPRNDARDGRDGLHRARVAGGIRRPRDWAASRPA